MKVLDLHIDAQEEPGVPNPAPHVLLLTDATDVKVGDVLVAKDGATFKVRDVRHHPSSGETACIIEFCNAGAHPQHGDELTLQS